MFAQYSHYSENQIKFERLTEFCHKFLFFYSYVFATQLVIPMSLQPYVVDR